MWELISLKEQSKFKMIEAFYITNEPITIEILSEETNTSVRSIKNYLNEMKEPMEEIGAKFISSSEGVNFEIPLHIGIDYFQKKLYRESTGFKLLEKILFDETLSGKDLAEELFISPSTLTRLTKTVQERINSYGLQLETNPYRMVGDERLVRHFYRKYFMEAYYVYEWPFLNIDEALVDSLLPGMNEFYKATSSVMNYHSFRARFAVNLTRSLNGHSEEDIMRSEPYLLDCYNKILPGIRQEVMNNDTVRPDEIDRVAESLAFIQVYISEDCFEYRLTNDNNFRNQHEEIEEMIHFLGKFFELPTENSINLVREIGFALLLLKHYPTGEQPLTYLLYPPRNFYIVSLYKRKYTSFYDTAKNYFHMIAKNRGISLTNYGEEFVLYTLFSNWQDLTKHLFGQFNTTKVLVYNHLGAISSQNLADMVKNDLPAPVEVKPIYFSHLTKEVLAEYDFDVLVSSITLFLDIEQPIVYAYKSRFSYQFEQLHQIIRNIATEKEQMHRERLNKNMNSPELQQFLNGDFSY